MQTAGTSMLSHRIWLLLVLTYAALEAPSAQAQSRVEALAGAGASFRHTTAVDLAEIAGESGYGSGDDTSPGALGFELRAGVLFPIDVELDTTATIAVGGLNLSRIERRYLGSEPDQLGSSLTASWAFSPRFAPTIAPDVRLLLGPGLELERMATSSPAGDAHVDSFGFGLDAGARLETNRISRVVDGALEFVLFGRREVPYDLRVARGPNTVLFSGTDAGGPPIYSFGIAVEYVFSFHAKR